MTPTVTATPTPAECLRIACPEDFYYNTILLSWTPIYEADHYQFDCLISGIVYSFDLIDNWLRIIAQNRDVWNFYVDLGSIPFRVTALDREGNIVEGPTDIAFFTCYNKFETGYSHTENLVFYQSRYNPLRVC